MANPLRIAFLKARWHADIVDRAHEGFTEAATHLMPGAQIIAIDVRKSRLDMAAELGVEPAAMQKALEKHVRAHLDELAEVRPDFR